MWAALRLGLGPAVACVVSFNPSLQTSEWAVVIFSDSWANRGSGSVPVHRKSPGQVVENTRSQVSPRGLSPCSSHALVTSVTQGSPVTLRGWSLPFPVRGTEIQIGLLAVKVPDASMTGKVWCPGCWILRASTWPATSSTPHPPPHNKPAFSNNLVTEKY